MSVQPAAPEGSQLGALGLSEPEERVYLAVLGHPGAPRSQLARLAGNGNSVLAECLERLVLLGLIRPMRAGSPRYVANRPNAALAVLAHRKLAALAELRLHSDQLAQAYRDAGASGGGGSLAESIIVDQPGRGRPSGLGRILARLLSETVWEVLGIDGHSSSVSPVSDEIATEAPVLNRGVTVRGLYRLDQILIPGRLNTLRELAELGERSRVGARLPHELFVFDRRIALLAPTVTGPEPAYYASGVVVRSPTMVCALVWLFEHHWHLATPLPLGTEAGHRDLAVKLAAGLKDEAIADALGLSVKTVRRRIAALLAELGVGTRFEAGVEAARHGWV